MAATVATIALTVLLMPVVYVAAPIAFLALTMVSLSIGSICRIKHLIDQFIQKKKTNIGQLLDNAHRKVDPATSTWKNDAPPNAQGNKRR